MWKNNSRETLPPRLNKALKELDRSWSAGPTCPPKLITTAFSPSRVFLEATVRSGRMDQIKPLGDSDLALPLTSYRLR